MVKRHGPNAKGYNRQRTGTWGLDGTIDNTELKVYSDTLVIFPYLAVNISNILARIYIKHIGSLFENTEKVQL